MTNSKTSLAAILLLLLCTNVWAATQKPAAKPKPKPSPVLGAKQFSGENAQFGTTYTLGKDAPVNFTLNSAEYTVGRVPCGSERIIPTVDEKTLVIHFTVQNPRPEEAVFNWATLSYTAVDINNASHEYTQYIAFEKGNQTVDISLKPGQKLDAYTTILVPARGIVPKLIVKSQDNLVLRYDLRGKIKPLAAPFLDPNCQLNGTEDKVVEADKKGANALAIIPAQLEVYYPTGSFDTKVIGFSYTNSAINENDPSEGGRFLVVLLIVKNQQSDERHINWAQIQPEVKTTDGEKLEWNQEMLLKSRDAQVDQTINPGDEMTVRFYFDLPSSSEAKTFTLQEGDNGRCYSYSVK